MAQRLRIAVTVDLHWGHHGRGDEAVRLLASFLRRDPPDLLVLAGDVGAADRFHACLGLFDDLPCRKALVPGNHDIWVTAEDARGDSLAVYGGHLPALCAAHGVHYLDAGPLVLPEADLAVVGSINWYDYSWSLDELRRLYPRDEWRVAAKQFPRGWHNDGTYVRWPLDDLSFTARVTEALGRHLAEALSRVGRAVVVTHHPPFRGLAFPAPPGEPPSLDNLLWNAFTGNAAVEGLLARHEGRIPLAFCGHTHRAREAALGGVRGYNVGGDYHFKRLLWVEDPSAGVVAHEFGDPAR
jgi:predicted phosphohydrolase